MTKPLVASLEFLESFGFFDVVLPFLFVFTLLYAVLEKTKILGTEGEKHVPKKNLNAMVSFAVALFVVAATNIVDIIRQSLPMVVLVLVVIISFLLLAGSFMGSEEFSFKDNTRWKGFLTVVMFLAVILIFMSLIKNEAGISWLNLILNYIKETLWTGPVISSIIFLAVIAGVIWFVVYAGKEKPTAQGP